jgi:hypothetical protein
MKALYDARVGDLAPGDLVKVECVCGHVEVEGGVLGDIADLGILGVKRD